MHIQTFEQRYTPDPTFHIMISIDLQIGATTQKTKLHRNASKLWPSKVSMSVFLGSKAQKDKLFRQQQHLFVHSVTQKTLLYTFRTSELALTFLMQFCRQVFLSMITSGRLVLCHFYAAYLLKNFGSVCMEIEKPIFISRHF